MQFKSIDEESCSTTFATSCSFYYTLSHHQQL